MAKTESTPPAFDDAVKRSPDLTIKQYKIILEVIAGRMSTLHKIIILAQGSDGIARAVQLDAAEAMACHIGSLVDDTTGGDICGDSNYWNYGQSFATAGKEEQHG